MTHYRAAALGAAIVTAVIAFAALAGCVSSSSTVTVSPTVSAAAHAAEQRGITILENCTPNGKAMIGPVADQTATALTYAQVFKFFKSKANRQAVWACATRQAGTASVPGTDLKTQLEDCFAKSPAATNLADNPFHSAHHPAVTARALVNAAAVCVGTDV